VVMPSLTRRRAASAFLPAVQCDAIQEDSWREHVERASRAETARRPPAPGYAARAGSGTRNGKAGLDADVRPMETGQS
jgi:hypothetical protein